MVRGHHGGSRYQHAPIAIKSKECQRTEHLGDVHGLAQMTHALGCPGVDAFDCLSQCCGSHVGLPLLPAPLDKAPCPSAGATHGRDVVWDVQSMHETDGSLQRMSQIKADDLASIAD
jgi:hypothetical protein